MTKVILIVVFALTASTAWAAGSPVRIDEGDTLIEQTDITVTSGASVLIRASNSNRAVLNCWITGGVRWGSSAVTATKGQLIPSNSPVAIRNTAAIYMIAEDESAIVSCTEETFSSSSSNSIFSP